MVSSLDLGELNKRLGREKAKSGAITASLMWNDPSDLDLHAFVEQGKITKHIFYGNKRDAGGHLDVDMNVDDKGKRFSLQPVENIFWKSPPGGKYTIFVRNAGTKTDPARWPQPEYKDHTRKIPFKVFLNREGKMQQFAGQCVGHKQVDCFKFTIEGPETEGTGGGGCYIVFPPSPAQATFKDLCAKYKVEWKVGSGFYAVARTEKIHNGKELLLQNVKADKFVVGRDKVLKFLGWPDSELKKGPKDLPADHMLFVQSTSYNRVIPPGTHVLFEVTKEEHAKHQKVNAAALKAAQQAAKQMASGGGAAAKAAPAAKAAGKAKAKAGAPAPAAKAGAKAGAKRAASPSPAAPAPKRAAGGGGGGGGDGKVMVFTGALTTPRGAATAAAKSKGYNVAGSVSRGTHILVAGPGAGSKMAKAQTLGVEVWDEAKFRRAVGL